MRIRNVQIPMISDQTTCENLLHKVDVLVGVADVEAGHVTTGDLAPQPARLDHVHRVRRAAVHHPWHRCVGAGDDGVGYVVGDGEVGVDGVGWAGGG